MLSLVTGGGASVVAVVVTGREIVVGEVVAEVVAGDEVGAAEWLVDPVQLVTAMRPDMRTTMPRRTYRS